MSSQSSSATVVQKESSNAQSEYHDAISEEIQLQQPKTEVLSIASSALSLVTNDIHLLADSLNSLSFDFYHTFMSKLEKNVVFAPFSISSLITMCYFSADDQTRHEISNLLHFKKSFDDTIEMKQMFIILFNLLKKISSSELTRHASVCPSSAPSEFSCQTVIDQEFKFQINSTIYCRAGYLLDKFKKNLIQVFNADILIENVDSANFEKLLRKVNYTPRKITNKNINEMIFNEYINEKMFMLMINTLQFEGAWKHEIVCAPEIGYFKVSDDKTIEVSLMKLPEVKFMYAKRPNDLPLRICEIPFKNDAFTFVIILPEMNCMDQVEKMLNYTTFNDILNKMVLQRLTMVLPKFQIYDNLDYKDLFSSIPSIVDFSKVKDGLGINKSTYKSYIRLCEKGIEASCCNSLCLSHEEINYSKIYKEHPCEDFKCDRPFLFFIREKNTKVILFMGKLLVPN